MGDPPTKSPKQSAANSRPPEPVLFLDRSLGRKIVAAALRTAGAVVEVHDDHFAADSPDETWLEEVGRRGWIVLTKDKQIRYRKNELAAAQAANVRLFVLTAGQLCGDDIGKAFVVALPRILLVTAKTDPPFVARVTGSGSVRLLDLGSS
jgi:hypothetical protein